MHMLNMPFLTRTHARLPTYILPTSYLPTHPPTYHLPTYPPSYLPTYMHAQARTVLDISCQVLHSSLFG